MDRLALSEGSLSNKNGCVRTARAPRRANTPLTLSASICFMFCQGLNGAIPSHTRSWGAQGSCWATGTRVEVGRACGETQRAGGKPPPGIERSIGSWGASRGRGSCPSPLPWELGVPGVPGWRCRNRCLGVSPGLNDSELRPTGNRELSFRRCPPARVSSRRQRELWARRMGAGEGDPARGIGSRGVRAMQRRAGQSAGAAGRSYTETGKGGRRGRGGSG